MATRVILLLWAFLAITFLIPVRLFASAYQLTAVGSLNTSGAAFSRLWYTNGNLTFTGVAPAGEVVTATIDGAQTSLTADSSGNWSHPASLVEGDHSVVFAAAGTNFANFTLTIGSAPEDIGELKTSATPTAGAAGPTIAVLSLGSLLAAFGLLLRRRLA